MAFKGVALLLACMFAAKCADGILLDPCGPPRPCARPPPDACTEPRYEIINGVKCRRCYNIVDCEQPNGFRLGPVYKPGRCPINQSPDVWCALVVRPGDCGGDQYCPGSKKCCTQGCGRECQYPAYW